MPTSTPTSSVPAVEGNGTPGVRPASAGGHFIPAIKSSWRTVFRCLLRFDDICPAIDWRQWEPIEAILRELDIKPLMSVIPDNRDRDLAKARPDKNFWNRVRDWQALGWKIGLHGYQHRYLTRNAGLVGIRRYSEFASRPREQQQESLQRALAIFEREGVTANVWVAPGHSFDATTVSVLHSLGIRTISDGYNLYPRRDRLGMLWIPQQLGVFRRMPFGLWTICGHLGDYPYSNPASFRRDVTRLRDSMIGFDDVVSLYPCAGHSRLDDMFATGLLRLRRLKAYISDVRSQW